MTHLMAYAKGPRYGPEPVTTERLNEALKRPYFDPILILADHDGFEKATEHWVVQSRRGWSANERAQLKEEITNATVFCVGMAPIWGRKVKFSPNDSPDHPHDCLLLAEGTPLDPLNRFRTLQLKALTGNGGTLQSIIDDLEKYNDQRELYVAIAIDRPGEYDFSTILISDALRERLREVWLFGRLAEDREQWVFRGDMLQPKNYKIRIVGPPPALKKRES